MKHILFAWLCMLLMQTAAGQNAIAKLKYEEAEEAYVGNNYATTLSKLAEAEKLLGSVNPRILYLRLMALKGIINSGYFEYAEVDAARKGAAYYLKAYENNEGIEEKYQDVYKFSEALRYHPASKAEWDKKIAQKLEADAQRTKDYYNKQKLEAITASKVKSFIDSVLLSHNMKIGMTLEDFKQSNPGNFKKMKRLGLKSEPNPIYKNEKGSDIGPIQIHVEKGIITYVILRIYNDKQMEKVNAFYNNLKKSVVQSFPAGQPGYVIEQKPGGYAEHVNIHGNNGLWIWFVKYQDVQAAIYLE